MKIVDIYSKFIIRFLKFYILNNSIFLNYLMKLTYIYLQQKLNKFINPEDKTLHMCDKNKKSAKKYATHIQILHPNYQ